MSEQLRHSPENKTENIDFSAEIEQSLKRAEKEAQAVNHEQLETTEIQNKIEQHAVSGKEISIGEKEDTAKQEFGVYAEMKSQTYERTLGRVRSRLSAPEKAMSSVMHNKVVESLSNGVSKTAARPSGILGAGIVTLLGSSVLLYMAKYYGFQYNFFFFFILLAAGFVLGIVIELVIRAYAKARR
ncbi:hypothetical protein H0X10_03035 [Candidatus Saccharibacteria bacterium]|nr:hypothetical protein [Candidatus Saccharibacteria bacterium]